MGRSPDGRAALTKSHRRAGGHRGQLIRWVENPAGGEGVGGAGVGHTFPWEMNLCGWSWTAAEVRHCSWVE